MSGFFWNIRGLNKSSKQFVIRDWVSRNSLKFGCILETKVKQNRTDRVMHSMLQDWNLVLNYEFSRRGRIWVVWSNDVKLQVISKSGQMITCSIQVAGRDEEFWCSFIYASNFTEERKILWRDIKAQHTLASSQGKPWAIFGDFNEILDLEEHSGFDSLPIVTYGMRDFQELVRSCLLMELKTHGPIFT